MKKDKVLLLSLWGNINYGNKLQNYALVRLIEKLEYDVVIIKAQKKISLKERIRVLVKKLLLKCGFGRYQYIINIEKREKYISRFSDYYIKEYENVKKYDTRSINSEEYKYAVVGSDQVWRNWHHSKKELELFYLTFMPQEKRIAYACSFGFEFVDEADKKIHVDGLTNLKFCSCREQAGKKIVKELIDRDVPVVLDPTLCLTRSEWVELSRKPEYVIETEYLLIYFLGGISDSYRRFIQETADKDNLEIIDIWDMNNKKYYTKTGPNEFIWLIEHAKYVCTDSFHATVFSILFHTRFLTFHRKDESGEGSYDRIHTLLDSVGLEKMVYPTCKEFRITEKQFELANKRIQEQKEFSLDFLTKALDRDAS